MGQAPKLPSEAELDEIERRAHGRYAGLIALGRAYYALIQERDQLRAVVDSECVDHANNCCASWCSRCQANQAARNALG